MPDIQGKKYDKFLHFIHNLKATNRRSHSTYNMCLISGVCSILDMEYNFVLFFVFTFKRWAHRQFKCFDLIIIISDGRMRDHPHYKLSKEHQQLVCMDVFINYCTAVGRLNWLQKLSEKN